MENRNYEWRRQRRTTMSLETITKEISPILQSLSFPGASFKMELGDKISLKRSIAQMTQPNEENFKVIPKNPCLTFPAEILSAIFDHCSLSTLHSCTLVDKKWNSIATCSLWYSPWSQMAVNWKYLLRTLNKEFLQRQTESPRYAPLIKELVFSDIYYIVNDHLLKELLMFCNNTLQTLIIDTPRQFTDSSVRFLANFCHNLKRIELRGCTRITDMSMVLLAERCPLLSTINLENCPKVSDATFSAIALNCGLHVKIMSAANSLLITDKSLSMIARHCPNMRELNLACCRNITDAGVIELSSISTLRILHIPHCDNLTNPSLKALGTFSLDLEWLSIIGCRVSEEGVKSVIEGCRKLKFLRISEQYGNLSREFLNRIEDILLSRNGQVLRE